MLWHIAEWVFGWLPLWVWIALAFAVLASILIWLRSIGVPLATAVGAALAAAGAFLAIGASVRGRAQGRADAEALAREKARQAADARKERHDETDKLSGADVDKRLNRWVRPD